MQRTLDQQSANTGTVVDIYSKFGEDGTNNTIRARGLYAQGLVYLARGDKATAKECFTRSLAITPSNVWAKYFLSTCK